MGLIMGSSRQYHWVSGRLPLTYKNSKIAHFFCDFELVLTPFVDRFFFSTRLQMGY